MDGFDRSAWPNQPLAFGSPCGRTSAVGMRSATGYDSSAGWMGHLAVQPRDPGAGVERLEAPLAMAALPVSVLVAFLVWMSVPEVSTGEFPG
jgi:hypothetical protein